MNHDVFISYSSKEKSIADGVCHYLEENGIKCWMAPRDIPAGSQYGDLIVDAIVDSKVVVLVYSQAALNSKFVSGEINLAFSEGKPIIPFRIDNTDIQGAFKLMLNQYHWIEAYPEYAHLLPDLLRSVRSLLGGEEEIKEEEEKSKEEDKRKITKEEKQKEKEK
ncbi:MAG: toll/interleukin-1 receptor domain-containing protein [Bacteroidales bacterium]|nr:toll/interleukin-1 receptor domain-containing protein [Bacteroidales bacterium]